GGARLVEVIVAAYRRAHQEAIAFLDDAFAIAGFDVRVADNDVVFFAGLDHARHLLEQLGVLVLARDAELLPEIAFSDQDAVDAFARGQHLVEVLDAAHVLDLQDDEHLAIRIERPHVGLRIIFLLRQSPVPRRTGWPVAADAGRLIILRGLEPRI